MNIREQFLNFFKKRYHDVVPSASLSPDDPTVMFTNAGMVQFKDIFTGKLPIPQNPKATSCQLCLRAGGKHNDLDNVGFTSRHHTAFEMLGNFSFGDYFKKEAISYAWEFITLELKLPVDKLWVTVHIDDEEAYSLWQKHIDKSRIKKLGDKDNFWSMGDTGACGPCSEIFYDQGEELFNDKEDYLGGDGDRFLEIWNLVFMQFDRDKSGKLNLLPNPSIDTGMGLERVVAIKEGVSNNYDSSLFMPIINKIEDMLKIEKTEKNIASFRVIADHTRAITFMLGDGILFDKDGRGYVARRIIRRAIRHGYMLGLKEPFMAKLVDILVDIMPHYSSIKEKKEFIKEQITLEEQRFFKTLKNGIELFEYELNAKGQKSFDSKIAFKLYDTYGFPLDLTQDMLKSYDISLNTDEFDKLMNIQKTRAKKSWKGDSQDQKNGDFKQVLETIGKNSFVGFDKFKIDTKILAIFDENFILIKQSKTESKCWIMMEQTPFYANGGGQVGSEGLIVKNEQKIKVLDTRSFFGLNLSLIKIENETINTGDIITAIDTDIQEVAKHHSATHLLQAVLKEILGDNVSQAGSLNDKNRLRFDFTYDKALMKDEIDIIQKKVNHMIMSNLNNDTKVLDIDEAKKQGAIAMFGEKYGNKVRVVNFGGISIEFCGGTHVKNSKDIGAFYIIKESGVSAGVRRIEAVCGKSAIRYTNSLKDTADQLQQLTKTKDTISFIKKLKLQNKELKQKLSNTQNLPHELNEQMVGDVKVIVDIVNSGELKLIADKIKNSCDKLAVFLLKKSDDTVKMVAGCKGIKTKAGDWIKDIAPIVGGGGGGRDDFAQAGGKDSKNIELAKDKALEYILKKLS